MMIRIPNYKPKRKNVLLVGLFDDSHKSKNGLDVMVDTLYEGLKERTYYGDLTNVYLMRDGCNFVM